MHACNAKIRQDTASRLQVVLFCRTVGDLDIDDIHHSAAEETQSNATVAGNFALYILRLLMLTILPRQS